MDKENRNFMDYRLDWVDGLKGLCCLIVVICHTFVTVSGVSVHANANIPIVHNLYDGNFAVSAFIILSTILTCHGIEKYKNNLLHRYRYIVAKRYFRLMVPVGFIILLMYFANLGGAFFAEEYGAETGNTWLVNITESWIHLPGSILGAPIQGAYTILRVSWMLPYVFFGTMWVIILDLLLRDKNKVSQSLFILLSGYVAWKCDFYYLNVVAGYALYLSFKALPNKCLRILLILLSIGIFVLSDFYSYSDEFNMLRAICLVSVVVLSSSTKKVFSIKILKNLGKISMNIYLLHLLVIYSITCRMADFMEHSIVNVCAMYITTIAISILLAFLFTKFVEVKLNRFTDLLLKRLFTNI